MKLRVVYNSRLVPPKFDAWVVFPFMIFKQAQLDVSDELFRHEMQHVYQILRYGYFGFHIRYFYHWLRLGYDKHPFEIEADSYQHQPLTTVERHFKDKLY